MRNIKKYISTALLGAVISLPSMASTMAAPIHIPSPQNIIDTSNPVVEVRRRGGISRGRGARRGGFSRGRGGFSRGRGARRGGFSRGRGGFSGFNRGGIYYRGGGHYRSNNVVPYIVGGIIVGGVAYQSQAHYSQHVAWCDEKYRSYNVRTDSFQPYNGPRRRCNSPYN